MRRLLWVHVWRTFCVPAGVVTAGSPAPGFPPGTPAPGQRGRGRPLTPRSVRDGPRGEQVEEAQVFGQVQQRHQVPEMGPHSLIPPTVHGVGIGPQTAGQLRPRQAGLLLEPLQALREVLGEHVDYSAVAGVLSRHGAGPTSAQSEALRSSAGASAPFPARLSPGAFRFPVGTLASPARSCALAVFGKVAADWATASSGTKVLIEPVASCMFVSAHSSLLIYWYWWRRLLVLIPLLQGPAPSRYSESPAAMSSQLDFFPSPAELTAATR